MFKITTLENPSDAGKLKKASAFILKFGAVLELLLILLIWIVIFSENTIFAGFTREEIITYIIGGSIISLFTGYLLQKMIRKDIESEQSSLLLFRPLKYFFFILTQGWTKILLPFAIAVGLHAIILYFFLDSFILNYNFLNIIIIGVMIILAFIFEFLLAYFLNLNVFWTIESPDFYRVLMRLKKILAGNYFPLSLLGLVFVNASLFLPFAYSFYVPAELYLNKISQAQAIRGIGIQIFWIIVFFVIIKMAWLKKVKQLKLK